MTSAAQRPKAVTPPATPNGPSGFFLPTDLYSNEPPLETKFHLQQIFILLSCLEWLWKERDDFFAAGNMTVYYSPKQVKTQDFRGPDFFVVLGTDPRQDRKSWVLWEEDGKYPNFIVEILSDSTAQVDRTTKKELYQNNWRVPEYFWFDPFTLEFEGFSLVNGKYQPIAQTEAGWRWSQQLGLYLGLQDKQLRYFSPNGELIPTLDEAAEQSIQQAEAAQLKAETAEAKAETAEAKAETAEAKVETAEAKVETAEAKVETAEAEAKMAKAEAETAKAEAAALKAKLRSLGIDPDA